ncbi:methyl-accepting chemotaxis protein [Pseudoalteromonas sp. Scap03]|uniref:methyl-accepting chemotaxis protein n=1 Tax=unclassified Pseudoalteromonas TaxID=194690 RepID=UPI0015BD3F81|nr:MULTISPECIES: methyl-accepting chemotaxis protein [unclassified Pseudoalteromonas]NWL16537.1 methyl-accepting chemotaxis protein [Pseudoalteromonas sp. Scap03]QLE81647.1 methyl-accepting chemotaxis protein [Pseudoalteromonas sp. Scap25]QLE89591.1 methyl-accepting chemotaxis protein [Pseudoalteromonas sp. Scap06]
MRINSIRTKVILPIAFLALILAGLLVAIASITYIQDNAMKRQTETFFEAVTVILNADRDIYQARIALENLLSATGDSETNKTEFLENAEQVKDRFNKYLIYLKDEEALLAKHDSFSSFMPLYNEWVNHSKTLINTNHSQGKMQSDLNKSEPEFIKIREMMDQAGEELRAYTNEQQQDKVGAERLGRYVEAISEVLNADRDIYQARLAKQKIVNQHGDLEQNQKLFEENAAQVIRRFNSYRSYLIDEPQLTQKYANFDQLYQQWYEQSKTLIYSTPAKQVALIDNNLAKADKSFNELRNILDVAGEEARTHARAVKQDVQHSIQLFEKIVFIVIIIAFIVALGVGYYIPKKLTDNINNITLRIKEIAAGDGDLTQRINTTSHDELADLSNEFDNFLSHLQTIIKNIQQQSSQLGAVTGDLNDVSDTAMEVTQKLANASESIVSAGHEMDMANQQMADLAKNTAQEADISSEQVKQGVQAIDVSGKAIEDLANDIESALANSVELESSSTDITSVLEVIRNIAEQTNLLALNAAIEAARAGEQGRGFAVVADEVRTLATRTQQSTDEIDTMIQRLNDNVKASSDSIKNSQTNANTTLTNFDSVITIFNSLTHAFEKVQQMSTETAQATQEQSHVANEINRNLVSLKEQSAQMKQISTQTTQQSKNVSALYEQMKSQVESFKV